MSKHEVFDTRKLSKESRRIVNRAILDGLTEILPDIDELCFASEVFKRKWTAAGSLRQQLRNYLDARLLCRTGYAGKLIFADVTQPHSLDVPGHGLWRTLGTNPLAACLGLEGSAVRHQDVDERKKTTTTRAPIAWEHHAT